ncbi:MAG: TonB-dependent receptor [Lentisphaerae bacterium]|nr:TonB-dependent receptor [Lentisphaerota bacterium]
MRSGWAAGVLAGAAAGLAAPAVGGTNGPPVVLDALVVTATRTAKDRMDVPASVTVIPGEAVAGAAAFQVDELFKAVGGVDLQGSGLPGAAVKLNLRGLTPGYQSKRVLVLVDGRRVNDAFQGNAEFALIPADGIARIEVLRGPASALYGSNALGGVINIVTRRGAGAPTLDARVAAGDYGTQQVQAGHGARYGALDYFVAASRVHTDGYTDNSDGTDRDWAAWNVLGNAGWRPGRHAALRLFGGAYRGEGRDENSARIAERRYAMAAWDWDPPRGARLAARAYVNDGRDRYDWIYPGEGDYRQRTLGAELQQTLEPAAGHRFTLGGEARREAVDIEDVSGPVDETADVLGLFAQDEIELGPAWAVTTGLRWDRSADYGAEWSPRLGVLWRADAATALFASANRAHRAPALSDRYVKTTFDGSVFEGNPDLRPETLTAWEAGVRRRLGGRISAEAAAFYNVLEDGFDFLQDPDGVFRIRNVNRARTAGLEARADATLSDRWSAWLTYSVTEGTYTRFPSDPAVEGNRLAYLAPHKAAAGVTYRGGRRGRHELRARYAGARYGDAQNTDANRMGDYVVVDWRSRVPLGGAAALTLKIDNLLDASYEAFPGVPQAGRFVMAGVELAL